MTFFTRFSSKPFYGIAVAFIGALIITPDTVFMRLSGMDAIQMLVWRGLAMSGALFGVWLIVSRGTLRQETANFFRPRALIVTFCFMLSAIVFTLGIASAPVSIILFDDLDDFEGFSSMLLLLDTLVFVVTPPPFGAKIRA